MDVSVTDLQVTRNGRTVLDIPALSFPRGTTTAVFGPNGSGKTTLLRAIAGLERPSRGEIRLGGLPVGPEPAIRQRVGMAFQSAVFVRGSVHQNLDLGLRLRRISAAERRSRIAEAADECGVAHLLERSARRLSSGEAQRVNLARALALRAPVTLLDEPLSGVDRVARTQLLADLPSLLARFTATTIVVTHDREEAFRLADRLVVLVEGRVKADGMKGEVYSRPRDRDTAELLGYSVIPVEGRHLAVPPGGLKPGTGALTLMLVVERVIDMGNHLHVVGTINGERVDLRLPAGVAPPPEGSGFRVHAEASVQLQAARRD